jgi:hypothetical protein
MLLLQNPHEKMGLAVMILGGLQFVFGFIRPDPPSTSSPTKSGLRVSWEFFHRWGPIMTRLLPWQLTTDLRS